LARRGRSIGRPSNPNPSATVIATTDAFGQPTQALQIANTVSYSRGIYATVPVSSQYSLAADIRVDQYSDQSEGTAADWAMQLTFAQAGVDNFCCTPQSGIYASSYTGGWRLFVTSSGPIADIDLGVPANVGTWYTVSLGFDVNTATFHSVIIDEATGMVLVDRFDVVAGLNAGNTQYDSIAFFGGEVSTNDTIADVGTVDNVNISATPTPEPSTFLLIGTGLSLLAARLRKR
jgi:PEP-CTERM motif